jgi:hypothetical protein
MRGNGQGDAEKARYWQRPIGEAGCRSGVLPAPATEEESVLLVAASASDGTAARR